MTREGPNPSARGNREISEALKAPTAEAHNFWQPSRLHPQEQCAGNPSANCPYSGLQPFFWRALLYTQRLMEPTGPKSHIDQAQILLSTRFQTAFCPRFGAGKKTPKSPKIFIPLKGLNRHPPHSSSRVSGIDQFTPASELCNARTNLSTIDPEDTSPGKSEALSPKLAKGCGFDSCAVEHRARNTRRPQARVLGLGSG